MIRIILVVVAEILDRRARALCLNHDTPKIATTLSATRHNCVVLPLAKGRERLWNR